MALEFQAYGKLLKEVLEFKYLGRVLTSSDDNWLAVVGNLKNERRRWTWMSRILGREGADPVHPRTSTRRWCRRTSC